eukprot:4435199-Amphidinium_carterae.1
MSCLLNILDRKSASLSSGRSNSRAVDWGLAFVHVAQIEPLTLPDASCKPVGLWVCLGEVSASTCRKKKGRAGK